MECLVLWIWVTMKRNLITTDSHMHTCIGENEAGGTVRKNDKSRFFLNFITEFIHNYELLLKSG